MQYVEGKSLACTWFTVNIGLGRSGVRMHAKEVWGKADTLP